MKTKTANTRKDLNVGGKCERGLLSRFKEAGQSMVLVTNELPLEKRQPDPMELKIMGVMRMRMNQNKHKEYRALWEVDLKRN